VMTTSATFSEAMDPLTITTLTLLLTQGGFKSEVQLL
jgi:hypothetical protein